MTEEGSGVLLSRRCGATSPQCGSTQHIPLDAEMAQVCPACRYSFDATSGHGAVSSPHPGKVLGGAPWRMQGG